MAKDSINEKLKGFGDRLKNEPVAAVIQQVIPVKSQAARVGEETEQLNVRIPKTLKKKLKAFAVEADASAQDIVTDALRVYLLGEERTIK